MADYAYDERTFRQLPSWESDLVGERLQLFSALTAYRNQGFASHWEEVAQLIEPNFTNTFVFGNYNTPGQKKTMRQIDSTGALANARFAAICDSLLTPRNMVYQRIAASNEYVMKDRATRLWFDQVTKILFQFRYAPEANFSGENHKNYRSLGAFGNMAMFIDQLDDPILRGLRYRSIPLGELFVIENHQGRIDGFIRWFRLTARQADQLWPGMLPPNMHSAYGKNSQVLFNFLHCVIPRRDYDPQRLDAKGKRWQSLYVSMEGRCLMYKQEEGWEGGYNTFPLSMGRYEQAPLETYGRGPAMMVLPALKTLNAQKTVFLEQGHRAIAPVYISYDDGIVGFKNRPGAMNPGGVNADGRPLVHTLPTGDIQISKEMMGEERQLINDAFLVTLFQILVKTPQMSATEVIERANEKGILLAPTMGRQQGEYIGPMTDRELDLLAQMRVLPPMPPRLREAQGEYHIVYDNPLSRLAKAQEGAGFLRTLESVKELVNITGDASLLDPFNFDEAIPGLAHQNAVPEPWMATDEQISAKRDARGKAQARQEQIQAAPAQAALAKVAKLPDKSGQGGQPQPQPQQQEQPQ